MITSLHNKCNTDENDAQSYKKQQGKEVRDFILLQPQLSDSRGFFLNNESLLSMLCSIPQHLIYRTFSPRSVTANVRAGSELVFII